MIKNLKRNFLNSSVEEIDPLLIPNKNIKNISNGKMIIPKISLNEKKVNSLYFLKDKKKEKSTHYNYDNCLKKNYSFLFCKMNKDSKTHYKEKNKRDINNLIMNRINKKHISTLKNNFSKSVNDDSQKTKDTKWVKGTMNKSLSLPMFYLKKDKEKKFNNKNNDEDNIDMININYPKKLISQKPKIFSKMKVNNSDWLINLRNYLEYKKKERNYIYRLINNPKKEDFENYMKLNPLQKIYSPLESQLNFKSKKVSNDTLELISNVHDNIKSKMEQKYNNKEEQFIKKAIRKRINNDELKCNDNNKSNFIFKPKNNSNFIVNEQIELIRKKINDKNPFRCEEVERNNAFKTKLYLSISQPYDNLFNTKFYYNLVDDENFLNSLHKDEKEYIK